MSDSRRRSAATTASLWLLALSGLSGCSEANRPPQAVAHEQALHQHSASFVVPKSADLALEHAEVVLEAGWGSGPQQLGQRQEASRPGPMSLAVDAQGDIFLLDQINRRICRYDATGRLLALIPLQAETTEEICLDGDSLWALVYLPGPAPGYLLEQYQGGALRRSLPLNAQLGPLTGLFAVRQQGASDVWVEVAHDRQLRVVREGRSLAPEEQRQAVLGRPLAGDPSLRLTARRTSPRQAAVIQVEPGRQASLLFTVTSERPLLSLHQLASDRQGRIFLGLELGSEGGPPRHELRQVRRLMLVRWPAGDRTQVIELAANLATDRFRDTAVGPDGAVYQLQTHVRGATLRRWRLPLDAPPQDGVPPHRRSGDSR